MIRYFIIFIHLIKNNLIRELEFRANFILQIVMQSGWGILQIVLIEIMFQFTNSIVGWEKYEIFFLIGLFRATKGIFDVFIYANILHLPEKVNSGELDYNLTRPINSLFVTSLRRHQLDQIGTILVGITIVFYSIMKGHLSLQFGIIGVVLLSFCGVMSFYCLMLMFSTLSFYLSRLRALSSFYDVLSNVLRVPTDIFLFGNKYFDSTILLVSIVITLPTKILLGKIGMVGWGIQLAGTVILFIIAYKFWNYSLKHYSSASS